MSFDIKLSHDADELFEERRSKPNVKKFLEAARYMFDPGKTEAKPAQELALIQECLGAVNWAENRARDVQHMLPYGLIVAFGSAAINGSPETLINQAISGLAVNAVVFGASIITRTFTEVRDRALNKKKYQLLGHH